MLALQMHGYTSSSLTNTLRCNGSSASTAFLLHDLIRLVSAMFLLIAVVYPPAFEILIGPSGGVHFVSRAMIGCKGWTHGQDLSFTLVHGFRNGIARVAYFGAS